MVADIARMEEILPDKKTLADVLENVLGRAVSEQIAKANPEGALQLVNDVAAALPDEVAAHARGFLNHWRP